MNKRIIAAAAAAAAAFAVAGCEPENQATYGDNASAAPGEALAGRGAEKPLGTARVSVASKEPFGEYLVNQDGRALYVLSGTRRQDGQANVQDRCTGACLQAWPPFHSDGAPTAGPGLDAAQLGTISMNGSQHVTYAGWPLYYYEPDRSANSTSGHGTTDEFGEWRLISPSGEMLPGGDPGKAPR